MLCKYYHQVACPLSQIFSFFYTHHLKCCFFHATDMRNFSDRKFTNKFKYLFELWSHITLSIRFINIRTNLSNHSIWTYARTACKLCCFIDSHPNCVCKLLTTLVVIEFMQLEVVCNIHVYFIKTHRCKIRVVFCYNLLHNSTYFLIFIEITGY